MPDLPADRLLITVASFVAETSGRDCPQLSTRLEELVRTTQEREDAGAA